MKKEELFNIIGEVDEQKILKANKFFFANKKIPKGLLKWGALAACLIFTVVSAIGVLTKKQPVIVTLSNGDEINFNISESISIHSLAIPIADSRNLSKAEAESIFETCNIEAYVSFEEGSYEFITLDGTIDGFSINVNRKDIPSCVEVEGEESLSYINGIPVNLGYSVIKSNATAVVYGEFSVGNYRVHVETAGDKSNLEILCKKVADELLKLLENSSLDFEQIKY